MELYEGDPRKVLMHNNDPSPFRWEEWDWRPLARMTVWLLMAGTWAMSRGMLSVAVIERAATEIILGWLLSFGLLTYVQVLIATFAIRLALVADDFAYAAAERIVRLLLASPTFEKAFLAAFALEILAAVMAARLLAAFL